MSLPYLEGIFENAEELVTNINLDQSLQVS